jgi:hypothetical protein
MNDDSVVSPGRFGDRHIDGRRLKKRTQALDGFMLAADKLETHAVPSMNEETTD